MLNKSLTQIWLHSEFSLRFSIVEYLRTRRICVTFFPLKKKKSARVVAVKLCRPVLCSVL